MGSEFVRRKSSVWAKKSDTKPSLFTSRPFSVPTNEDNIQTKKELPKEVPPPDYIFSKIGFNITPPAVQHQEDNSQHKEPEQEADINSKSDVLSAGDEDKVSLKPQPLFPYPNLPTVQRKEDSENEQQEESEVDSKSDEVIQAKCSECKSEEQQESEPVQTKLTVGEPGDKYEQEADAVAAKVVEQINLPKSEQPVQSKVEPVVKSTLMRQGGAAGGTVNRDVEQNIQQARGGGQGLADNVREPMEQAFGADFSGVKVHTDGQADTLNRSLNSRAFATGQDIFFRQGEYNPGSKQGQELLAHELTHVVQQTSDIRRNFVIQKTSDPLSLSQSLNPTDMSNAEIEQEIQLIHSWLRQNQESSPDANSLTASLRTLESELTSRGTSPRFNETSQSSTTRRLEIPLTLVAEPVVSGTKSNTPSGYLFTAPGLSSNVLASGDLSWLSSEDAVRRVLSRRYWSPMIPRRGVMTLDRLVNELPRDLAPRIEAELRNPNQSLSWIRRGFSETELRSIPDTVRRFNTQGISSLSSQELQLLRRAADIHIGGSSPGAPFASYMRPDHVLDSVGSKNYRVRVELPRTAALDVSGPNQFNDFGRLERITNIEEAEFLATANHEGRITNVQRATDSAESGFLMRNSGTIRWVGRGLIVVGLATSGYRIASATPEERPVVAAEEVGGNVGGALGTSAAVAGCVALGVATGGVGLFVCGLVGGFIGGAVGSGVAGSMARDLRDGTGDENCPSCHAMQRDWQENRVSSSLSNTDFDILNVSELPDENPSLTPEEIQVLTEWLE